MYEQHGRDVRVYLTSATPGGCLSAGHLADARNEAEGWVDDFETVHLDDTVELYGIIKDAQCSVDGRRCIKNKVLRRRIEDALRKTASPEQLTEIAGILGVKIF